MNAKEIETELSNRIQADTDQFAGMLPERFAIAWRSYLAGLLEWGVIDVATYNALLARVPGIQDDPAVAILRGREQSA
jgi:hypothetical protein